MFASWVIGLGGGVAVAAADGSVARWNDAAMRLFASTCGEGRANVGLFLPALLPAVDLLTAGAAGTTREELVAALGEPDHAASRRRVTELRAAFDERFDVGVRAWIDRSLAVDPAWQRLLVAPVAMTGGGYGGALDRFELATLDRPALVGAVNDWVSKVVAEPITVLREGDVAGPLRLLLACAARVEWRWATPFDERFTRLEPFHLGAAADAIVDLPMMQLRHAFEGFEVAGLPGLRVPCEGGLWLDLLRVGDDPKVVADLLARRELPAQIDAAVERLDSSTLLVLPKVDTFTLHELDRPLRSLGVAAAFSPAAADFSRLAGAPGELHLDLIRHACGVRWDEKGGKAIGATVVALKSGAPKSHELRLDVPFLALLRGKDGALLLTQWIADPRGPH